MMWQKKLAADQQRAVGYSIGKTSAIYRDIAAVQQQNADHQATEADMAESLWSNASHAYEIAVQTAMREADIPVALFRQPIPEKEGN